VNAFAIKKSKVIMTQRNQKNNEFKINISNNFLISKNLIFLKINILNLFENNLLKLFCDSKMEKEEPTENIEGKSD